MTGNRRFVSTIVDFKFELIGEVLFTHVTLADKNRVLFLLFDVFKVRLQSRRYMLHTHKVYMAIKNASAKKEAVYRFLLTKRLNVRTTQRLIKLYCYGFVSRCHSNKGTQQTASANICSEDLLSPTILSHPKW